jgi:hypothetical protein
LDVGKERKKIKLKAYNVETQIKKEKRKVTVDRRNNKKNESGKDISRRETEVSTRKDKVGQTHIRKL